MDNLAGHSGHGHVNRLFTPPTYSTYLSLFCSKTIPDLAGDLALPHQYSLPLLKKLLLETKRIIPEDADSSRCINEWGNSPGRVIDSVDLPWIPSILTQDPKVWDLSRYLDGANIYVLETGPLELKNRVCDYPTTLSKEVITHVIPVGSRNPQETITINMIYYDALLVNEDDLPAFERYYLACREKVEISDTILLTHHAPLILLPGYRNTTILALTAGLLNED